MKMKNLFMAAVAVMGFTFATIAQTIPPYVPTNGLIGWCPLTEMPMMKVEITITEQVWQPLLQQVDWLYWCNAIDS